MEELSPEDAKLSHSLALEAVIAAGRSRFTVYATLDIEKPETIKNFDLLGRLLLTAYKRGAASVRDA